MPDSSERWLWYERTGFVIAALIVFWPVGAALMWSQKKFTQPVRTWITGVAAVATVLVILAILPPPSGMVGTPTSTGAPSPTPSPSALATGTATSTASTTRTASIPTTQTGTNPGSGTAPNNPQSNQGVTPPSNYTPPSGPPQARFVMQGTYTTTEAGQIVDFTLTATPASGIVSWDWWVTASGQTSQYSGATVHDNFVGLAPTSVKLIAYDSSGKSYTSQAGVDVTSGKLYAAVR